MTIYISNYLSTFQKLSSGPKMTMHSLDKSVEFASAEIINVDDSPNPETIGNKLNSLQFAAKTSDEKLPSIKIFRIGHMGPYGLQHTLKNEHKAHNVFKSKNNTTANKESLKNNLSTANLRINHQNNKKRLTELTKTKTIDRRQKSQKKTEQFYLDQIQKVPFLKILNYEPEKALLPNLPLIDHTHIMMKNEEGIYKAYETSFQAFYTQKMCLVKGVKYQKGTIHQLDHPGILPIYGKLKIRLDHYIIMANLHERTLQKNYENFGPCTQRFIRKYIQELIEIVQFLKKQKITVTLLTPRHIYVTNSGSCMIDSIQCTKQIKPISKAGDQAYYLSPESIKNDEFSQKSVVWGIGCIALSMIFGRELNHQILYHPYNQKPENTSSIEVSIRHKISKILNTKIMHKNKKELEKLNKPFLNINFFQETEEFCDMIDSCLKFDKKNRPTLEQLSNFDFFRE